MSVDFNKILSPEQKTTILENSIQQFAAEGYRHELNKQVGTENKDDQLVEESQKAIDTLKAAIAVYEKELKAVS